MRAAFTAAGTLAIAMLTTGLIAGTAGAAQQQGAVYLWVDKNGTPHYEDRPNDVNDAKEMNLRYQLTDPQTIAAAAKQKTELDDAAKTREKQKADDKAEPPAKQVTVSERSDNCKAAKDRMEKYETAHKLYKPMPNGERQYLSDKEIDAARAEARRAVDEWCSK
jgi:hypothetical protein